jgi:hypothetical protein
MITQCANCDQLAVLTVQITVSLVNLQQLKSYRATATGRSTVELLLCTWGDSREQHWCPSPRFSVLSVVDKPAHPNAGHSEVG